MVFDGDVLVALFFVSMAAGIVDAIAGGGGLITLPALMVAGLTPAQAIATNKIQALASVASSAQRFARAGMVDLGSMKGDIGVAVVGAGFGAIAIQVLDSTLLSIIAPVILIGIALFFLLAPPSAGERREPRLGKTVFLALLVLPIGFYDGFLGPGTGSLYVAALTFFLGRDLRQATAETKVLNTSGSIIAALIFLPGGAIEWRPALAMMAGAIIGGQIGARAALKWGAPMIRTALVMISLALAIKLLVS